MKSMTGWGRKEHRDDFLFCSIEMKSYNNRYLDLSIQVPPYLNAIEPKIREFLQERIVHGKVEVTLRVRELKAPMSVSIDETAAVAGADAIRKVASAVGLDDTVKLSDILAIDGIISYDRTLDADEMWKRLRPSLEECFAEFDSSRRIEGDATVRDIEACVGRIKSSLETVKRNAPLLESAIRKTLKDKFKEVLGDEIDENRVLAETALYLVRYTVNEEIIRLESHLASFLKTLGSGAAAGKKLDFICQELNRETNTIGSKNVSVEIGEAVVTMKDAIENMREQLRNLE